MGTRSIERKLRRAARRQQELRAELPVLDAQLAQLNDDADDLRLRALVADGPGVDVEHRHARAHAEALARHRDDVMREIAELERRTDELLDRRART